MKTILKLLFIFFSISSVAQYYPLKDFIPGSYRLYQNIELNVSRRQLTNLIPLSNDSFILVQRVDSPYLYDVADIYSFEQISFRNSSYTVNKKRTLKGKDLYLGEERKTLDDGIVICGASSKDTFDISNNNPRRGFVYKLDKNFNIEWKTSIVGDVRSVVQMEDSSYVICGELYVNDTLTKDSFEMHGLHGGFDVFVAYLDKKGNLIWTKCLAGKNHEAATSVIALDKENALITGVTLSTDGDFFYPNYGRSNSDIFYLKINKSGSIQYLKRIKGSNDEAQFGCIKAVKCNSNSSSIFFTSSSKDFDFQNLNHDDTIANIGGSDISILHINNSDGNKLWMRNYGSSVSEDPYDILAVKDGYRITGVTRKDNSMQHPRDFDFKNLDIQVRANFLFKLDTSGNIRQRYLLYVPLDSTQTYANYKTSEDIRLASTGKNLFVAEATNPRWSNTPEILLTAIYDSIDLPVFKKLKPRTPDGLHYTKISGSAINLKWNDNSNNEEWFDIYRHQPGITDSTFTGNLTLENVDSLKITGILPNTKYKFWVRACNTDSCSDFSEKLELILTTGIENNNNPIFRIINTVNEFLRINSESDIEFNYQLMDMNGKEIYNGFYQGKNFVMDISNLPTGFYLFRISNDYQNQIIKLIKSN